IEIEQELAAAAFLDAAVPEQVDELTRMLLPGHEQHLADSEPLEQLEGVVDHRPASNRQQTLVCDACELGEPGCGPARATEAFHRGDRSSLLARGPQGGPRGAAERPLPH